MMLRRFAMGMIIGLWLNGASAEDIDALTAAARAQSLELIQELGAQLKQELARGGLEAAVSVCKDAAPEIASRLSRKYGARIARVSLKPRNPLLGTPDAWEQAVLSSFEQRVASGVKPDTIEAVEIVFEPQGRFFRYMKAIPVQPLCVACHGTQGSIAESVSERLRQDYPHDRATGYDPGQVRGALTVKIFLGK